MRKLLLLGVIGIFALMLWQESVEAIPAFARRYRLSCKTCHNPFPRLNDYGEEFAGNAFQLPDEEESARSYADVGDEKLALLRDFPVAARIDLHARYQPDDDTAKSDFRFPDRLKLLSGGAIYKDIAYYFYFYMSEHGEVAGVEDAYVHFNNLFNSEFDVIAGQFQVSDPLFKRELRLTYEDYWLYKQRIGESSVNLAYDRGMILIYSPVGGTDLVFELLNGNGIGPEGETGNLDDDSFKNFLVRGSQDLIEGLRVGAVYYFGRQTTNEVTNKTKFWGLDGTFDWKGSLTVNFQYLHRSDDDPFFTGRDFPVTETDGIMLEAVFGPKGPDSDYYLIFLYNWIDSDFSRYNYETVTFNASYMILRNMRLFGEYTRDIEREANSITGGLVFAF